MVTTRSAVTQQNTVTAAAAFESYSSFTTFFKTYNSFVFATVSITNAAGEVTTSSTKHTVPTTQAVTYPINSIGQVVTTAEVVTHQNTFTAAAAFESYSSFTTFFKTYNSFVFATVSITNAAGKVTTSPTTHTVPVTEEVTYPINTAGEVVTYSSHTAYSNAVTVAAGTTTRPVQVETERPQATPSTKIVTQRTSAVFYTDTFVTSYSTVTLGSGGITKYMTTDTYTATTSSQVVYGTTTTQAVHVTVTPSGYSAKAGVGATTTSKKVPTTPLVSNVYVDVTQYVTSYASATTDSFGHVSYVYLEYTGTAETAAETSSASGSSNVSSNNSSNSSNNSSGNTSNNSSNNSSGNASNNSSNSSGNASSNSSNSSGNSSNSSGNSSNNSPINSSNNLSNSSGDSSNNSSGSSNSSNNSSGNSSNNSAGSSNSYGSSNNSNNASSNSFIQQWR
ncbi:unnamed protein product [Ambrosiozyma monospora]|uniref:Unnamed protein product n=1 Tax=Ambrosiozyma monospora TaxID=43982 RepID=A0ACB5TZR8_AMBMO|nr:unnamed protein product [Ambrosiozyma monospora]